MIERMAELDSILRVDREMTERELSASLDGYINAGKLYEAMCYATLFGGKRIRAAVCIEICRMFNPENTETAAVYAAALELMHAASLVHDDMPEMDNDAVRRGKPACHTAYGSAAALLTGDSLICLSLATAAGADAGRAARAVALLSDAGGAGGIALGQLLEKDAEHRRITLDEMKKIQASKTGRLMQAAGALGALAASADGERLRDAEQYAAALGLAFQITDDLLDSGDKSKDDERGLTTFLTFYDNESARAEAERLTAQACAAIEKYPGSAALTALASRLLTRES